MTDHITAARGYMRGVLEGLIPACKWVRLAVQRQEDDLAKPVSDEWPWVFNESAAARPCRFIELLPHIKGKWARDRKLIELGPWQSFLLTTIFGWVHKDTGLRRFRDVYLEIPRKNAKALDLDTLLPTPSGWTTMGQVQAGDRLLGADGLPCTVLATSETFTDHDCYRLTFSNGETVVADAGHLWLTTARVNTPAGRSRAGFKHGQSVMTRVRTTAEIAQTVRFGARCDVNHTLAMPAAVQGCDVELLVEPYLLGVWLGDGTSASARLTSDVRDHAIVDAIRAGGCEVRDLGYRRGNATTYSLATNVPGVKKQDTLQARLRRLEVLNNKHIPPQYLRASYAQRLALLQGLMDTDGTVSRSGRVLSFTSTLECLAQGVGELLATFGIKHSIVGRSMRCNGRPVAGTAYLVQFMAFRNQLPVFKLPRKRDRMRCTDNSANAPRSKTVQIVACDKVQTRPTRCVSVDSKDNLFLFGRTMLPTHNSTLSSGVALYMLTADGEQGAEIYSAATTKDQARIVFNDAKAMAERSPGLRELGLAILQHALTVRETASAFKPLAAEGSTLDGLNVHFAVLDELHAHKTRAVYDVIDTARGAREQSLLWNITTSGTDLSGICYERRTYLTKVLDGVIDDHSTFGVIYTIDDGDNPFVESSWAKANPNWLQSVLRDDMEAASRNAENSESSRNNFFTKRLNVWVNGESAWMDMVAWAKCADPTLHLPDFAGEKCWMGLDLAQKKDFAALCLVFEREGVWYVCTRLYLNELAVQESGNAHLSGWARAGHVIVTDGDITDFDVLAEDMRSYCRMFDVQEIAFDPALSMYFAGKLIEEGLPLVEITQRALFFTPPLIQVENLVLEKKLKFDGNPVMTWMVSNLVVKVSKFNELRAPTKERPENKIDGPMAMLMALGRALSAQPQESLDDFIFNPVVV